MTMASRNVDATLVPQALETLADLNVNVTCYLENVSAAAVLLIRLGAVVPAADDRAHRLGPGDTLYVSVDAAYRIWVWTDDPQGCAAIVSAALE